LNPPLFLSAAGPYKNLAAPNERLVGLAERVEERVSTEHANWFNETKKIQATDPSKVNTDAK
jgi:hypothetical protein